jgi:hypothetical protein
MARTDLIETELAQLNAKARRVIADGEVWTVSKIDAGRVLRLTGEVLELRNREAHARQMHGLEDEY